ncbi:MAG: TraB/GumN family protein [Methanobrevibacter sp.]|jgi:pheromone shutdown-related protein TraB|nr:TraB/GumN family protein [Candidatus Methanovirga meridionalis]
MKKECLTIIGTAHVSKESVEEVKNVINEQQPEVVAIELDANRYKRLINERDGVEEENISITKIIKEDKVGIFIASMILTVIQSKIGDELDVKPGSEMIAAIEAGEKNGAEIALIDRDINITLQRTMNKMGTYEKLKFIFTLIYSYFDDGDDDNEVESIEDLKKQDVLEEVMEYFEKTSPSVYEVLVKERDAYLAKSILGIEKDHVVAVVGAGHKKGMNHYLDNVEEIPSLEELTNIEKKGFPWLKTILYLIPISFVAIFILALWRGVDISYNLWEFFLISGVFAFLGSILSGSKIQSAVVGFFVAVPCIIHPFFATGFLTGLTEAKYRKFKRSDIVNLTKIESFKDLWHNSIFRILLVVIGTDLSVSIATIIILPSIVFIPLASKIFGG